LKPYASFSPCRSYRYDLVRTWTPLIVPLGEPRKQLAVVMLNPSTADESRDDPTIRRVIGFAQAWGCGSLVVLNLFALRATDPDVMLAAVDPVGPQNDEFLRQYLGAFARNGLPVLAAWGVHGSHRGRDAAVLRIVPGVDWRCLGTTKDGAPRHPLYVRATTQLQPFGGAA
jgi:hypothetical protein